MSTSDSFMDIRGQLQEFLAAMEVPPCERIGLPTDDEVKKSARLLVEEVCEAMEEIFPWDYDYWRALKSEMTRWVDAGRVILNLPGLAKELADVKYVTEAAFQAVGVDSRPIEAAVHASNMSKLVDGRCYKREDGKILKGPNYTPPDIAGELKKQGWQP